MSDCFTVNERSTHIEQILVHRRTFACFLMFRGCQNLWRTGPWGCILGYVFAGVERIINDVSRNVSRLTYDVHSICQFLAAYSGRAHTGEIERGSPGSRCLPQVHWPCLPSGSRGGLLAAFWAAASLYGSYWPLQYSTNNECWARGVFGCNPRSRSLSSSCASHAKMPTIMQTGVIRHLGFPPWLSVLARPPTLWQHGFCWTFIFSNLRHLRSPSHSDYRRSSKVTLHKIQVGIKLNEW